MTTETPHDKDFIDTGLELLDHYLDVFHDAVLRPIFLIGRTLAYGFILVALITVAVVVALVGLIRILDVYAFAGREYLTYLVLGAVLTLSGVIIWRRRKAPKGMKS